MHSLVALMLDKFPGVRKGNKLSKSQKDTYQIDTVSNASLSDKSEDNSTSDSDDSKSDTRDSSSECSNEEGNESICGAMRSTGVMFTDRQVYMGMVRGRSGGRGGGRGESHRRRRRGRRGRGVRLAPQQQEAVGAAGAGEELLARCPCLDLSIVEAAGAGEGHDYSHEEKAWSQARAEARCGRFQSDKPKPKKTNNMPDDTDLAVQKRHFFEVEWFRKQCDLFIVPPSQKKDTPTNEVIAHLMQTARRHPVKESKLYSIDMEPKGRPLGRFRWQGSSPALKCMCPYKPCICHRTIPFLPKKKIPTGRGDGWVARKLLSFRRWKRRRELEEAEALAAAEEAADAAMDAAAAPSPVRRTAAFARTRDLEDDPAPLLAALTDRIEVERRTQDRILPYLEAMGPDFCLDACIPFYRYDEKCECDGIEALLKQVREEEEAIMKEEREGKRKQPVSRVPVSQPQPRDEERHATGIVACSYLVRWCSVGTQTEAGRVVGRLMFASTRVLHPRMLSGPQLHISLHSEESLTAFGRWRCEWNRRWREARKSFLNRIFTVREIRRSISLQVNETDIDTAMLKRNSSSPSEPPACACFAPPPSPPPTPPPPSSPPDNETGDKTPEAQTSSNTSSDEHPPIGEDTPWQEDTPPTNTVDEQNNMKNFPASADPQNSVPSDIILPSKDPDLSPISSTSKDLSIEPQEVQKKLSIKIAPETSSQENELKSSAATSLENSENRPATAEKSVMSNAPIDSSKGLRRRCCRSSSLNRSASEPSRLLSIPAGPIKSSLCTPSCSSRPSAHLTSDFKVSPTIQLPTKQVKTPRSRCCRYSSHATPDSQATSHPQKLRNLSSSTKIPPAMLTNIAPSPKIDNAKIVSQPRSRSCCHFKSSNECACRRLSNPVSTTSSPVPVKSTLRSRSCCREKSLFHKAPDTKESSHQSPTSADTSKQNSKKNCCRFKSSNECVCRRRLSNPISSTSIPAPVKSTLRSRSCCRENSIREKSHTARDTKESSHPSPTPANTSKQNSKKNIFKLKWKALIKPSKAGIKQLCECECPAPAALMYRRSTGGRLCPRAVTFDDNDYLVGVLDLSLRHAVKSAIGLGCRANTEKNYNTRLYNKIDEILKQPGVTLKGDVVNYNNKRVSSLAGPAPRSSPDTDGSPTYPPSPSKNNKPATPNNGSPATPNNGSPATPNNGSLVSDSTSHRIISSELVIQNISYEHLGTSEFNKNKQYNLRVEVLSKATVNKLKKISDSVEFDGKKPLNLKKRSSSMAWLHQRRLRAARDSGVRPGRHTLAFVSQRQYRH